MANWAIGFNSAIKSGWDTWNKLSGVRQAAARAQAADQVAANNKALENDNTTLSAIAGDARADATTQALTNTFGDASEATRAGAREYGILKDDGSLDYGKLQEYGQKFGAQPQQAIPTGEAAQQPPVVTDPQAEPVQAAPAQAIPGNAPQTDPNVAGVRDQMLSQGKQAFDESAQTRQAINTEMANQKFRLAEQTARKNREAMHEYNKWYDQDALEKEDEYELNQTFRAVGKLVNANDPGAMDFMAKAYSAMGYGNIRSNGDGTFTMTDKDGNATGQAFRPSMQQFGTLMTNLYNTARLMKTGDIKKYLESRKQMAEAEGAELKNVGQGYKNEQEKVAANVANKYGMRKGKAETEGAEANTDKAIADSQVAKQTVGSRVRKSGAEADSAEYGAQIKGEEAAHAKTHFNLRDQKDREAIATAQQGRRIAAARESRAAAEHRWKAQDRADKLAVGADGSAQVAGKPVHVNGTPNSDGTYTVFEHKNGLPIGKYYPELNAFYPAGTSPDKDKANFTKYAKKFSGTSYTLADSYRDKNGIMHYLVADKDGNPVAPITGEDTLNASIGVLLKNTNQKAIDTERAAKPQRGQRNLANAKNAVRKYGGSGDPAIDITSNPNAFNISAAYAKGNKQARAGVASKMGYDPLREVRE